MQTDTLEKQSVLKLAEESEKFSHSDGEEAKLYSIHPKLDTNVCPWN